MFLSFRAFSQNTSVAMMIDQRVSEGEKSLLFNKTTYTTTIPAQLIKKYKCPIVPIYIQRKNDIYFERIIAKGKKHPNGKDFVYGPQMVEVSRDGKRVYWTNSLYSTWDDQYYPHQEGGQMVMANVGEDGGLTLDPDFYVNFPENMRAHQIRLEGGDCSTDSFCYPSV